MIDRITEQPFCQTRVSGLPFQRIINLKNKHKMKPNELRVGNWVIGIKKTTIINAHQPQLLCLNGVKVRI